MNLPDYLNTPPIDPETGKWTKSWGLVMSQLLSELGADLNAEGFKMPSLPTTDINKLTDASKSTSRIVYDETTNQFKGNIDGTWKTFDMT